MAPRLHFHPFELVPDTKNPRVIPLRPSVRSYGVLFFTLSASDRIFRELFPTASDPKISRF